MKQFIFITNEGFTLTPNKENIPNAQVIGIAKGENQVDALKNLLKINPWIWDSGFNVAEFIGYEIAL